MKHKACRSKSGLGSTDRARVAHVRVGYCDSNRFILTFRLVLADDM
jgi:hypothetical protein